MFSLCHIHQILPDVGALHSSTGPRRPSPRTATRHARYASRREVEYSKNLLRSSPKLQLIPNYSNRTLSFYPRWVDRGSHPEPGELWSPWITRRFPLVVKAVREVGYAAVLNDAQETISFLKRRSLQKREQDLYDDKSTLLFPIAKFDAWLDLERLHGRC